ncbi:MAG: hypothetical protein K8R21_12195, partial [Leptospira sp.]|nr:hypothetical protein [Leptospira sp.]
LIEWSYDSKIVPGSSVSVDLAATALQNMTNATLVAELKQPLILRNGNLNTGSSTLNSGEKLQISAVVEAPETGSFEIDVHVSGFIAGNKMGSSRAIVFESFDYSGSSKEKSAKQKTEIIGGQEYSVLPGKTDNEKK